MEHQTLRNQTIYQVFVRNQSEEGTLSAVTRDLDRIKDLGIDILYLLPIHPIGEVARKGKYGSPYAIQDYRKIHPELGTLADFQNLIKESHKRDIKVMMDIVFNHTSRDAVYIKEHPHWYYYKDGKLANRIGDWSDVADLNFNEKEVRDFLIDTLIYYVKMGVDGFRCDVAPIIPLSFWKEAVKAVGKVNPHVIWLSESIEPSFIKYLRQNHYEGHSDAEMYQAFDVLYDYDIYPSLKAYLLKEGTLKQYLDVVKLQEFIFPDDYLKIHFLENHDQMRIAELVKAPLVVANLTAWSFFMPGMGFIYAGQERLDDHKPDLFEKGVILQKEKDKDFYGFIQKLISLKKLPHFRNKTRFDIIDTEVPDLILAHHESGEGILFGIFNLVSHIRRVKVPLEDGEYLNLIDGKMKRVYQGYITVDLPLYLKVK